MQLAKWFIALPERLAFLPMPIQWLANTVESIRQLAGFILAKGSMAVQAESTDILCCRRKSRIRQQTGKQRERCGEQATGERERLIKHGLLDGGLGITGPSMSMLFMSDVIVRSGGARLSAFYLILRRTLS